jgi:hypothetical protein
MTLYKPNVNNQIESFKQLPTMLFATFDGNTDDLLRTRDFAGLNSVDHLAGSVKNIHLEGDDLVGEFKTLETPNGRVCQALIDAGIELLAV